MTKFVQISLRLWVKELESEFVFDFILWENLLQFLKTEVVFQHEFQELLFCYFLSCFFDFALKTVIGFKLAWIFLVLVNPIIGLSFNQQSLLSSLSWLFSFHHYFLTLFHLFLAAKFKEGLRWWLRWIISFWLPLGLCKILFIDVWILFYKVLRLIVVIKTCAFLANTLTNTVFLWLFLKLFDSFLELSNSFAIFLLFSCH